MVLETTYQTDAGSATVVDALAMGEGNRGHDLGMNAPRLLVRQVTCTHGEVQIEVEYVPRGEYGLVHPLLDPVDGGLVTTGGADTGILSCSTPMAVDGSSAASSVVPP